MNPNDPNNLDPKLREAYERIMGTSQQNPVGIPQQTPVQAPTVPASPQPQNEPPFPQPKMQTEEVDIPQNDITQSPLSMGGGTFVNPNPSAAEVEEGNLPTQAKKRSNLMPIVIAVGVIVFFVVYAVVWSKVFGLF